MPQGCAGGIWGHTGYETASLVVASSRDKSRAGGGGRTTPVQAVQACRDSHARDLPAVLLYEVSSRGMGTARFHTAGWRYRVWTKCMCPRWQAGHTAPGAAAATVGGWRSTAASWGWGRVACPRRVRHCASFAWRTRLARKPKCRSLWGRVPQPCG